MSVSKVLLVISGLCLGAPAVADDEVPDAEFLEYLGMWPESDEDWVMLEEMAQASADSRRERKSAVIDPAPESEESPENEDES